MKFTAYFDETPHDVKIIRENDEYVITIDHKEPFKIDVVEKDAGDYSFIYKGRPYEFDIESRETHYNVLHRGKFFSLELINQKSVAIKSKDKGEKKLLSNMPGKIIKVLGKEGDLVKKGDGLIIMEAMKMENELKSPGQGKIKSIYVKEGQTVDAGEPLVLLE